MTPVCSGNWSTRRESDQYITPGKFIPPPQLCAERIVSKYPCYCSSAGSAFTLVQSGSSRSSSMPLRYWATRVIVQEFSRHRFSSPLVHGLRGLQKLDCRKCSGCPLIKRLFGKSHRPSQTVFGISPVHAVRRPSSLGGRRPEDRG